MSGGSYDYLYLDIDVVAEKLDCPGNPLREAFAEHLRKIAKAMHNIEWVDSGDCSPGDENESILDCFNNTKELKIIDSIIKELDKLEIT